MKKTLNWKKGLFSSCFEIHSKGVIVGRLKEKNWTNSAIGELNGKKYSFLTKGFLHKETQIVDNESNNILGKITYQTWGKKARIEIDNKVINWKFTNVWNTRWCLIDLNGKEINYKGSSSKGNIEFEEQNDLLLLTGLFITNYYWQSAVAAIVAVSIPIWFTIIN